MESTQCGNCQEDYNHFDRQRLMIPCGDCICLRCFDTLLQPQDSKLECIQCGDTSIINQRFQSKVQDLKKCFQSTIGIFCDQHPTLLAEIFCKEHQMFICDKCALEQHNHKEFLVNAKREQIEGFCDNAVGYLITLIDRVTSLVDNLNSYKSKDMSFTSSFLMATVKQVQDILTTSFLKTDKEKQNIAFITGNRDPQNQEEIKEPQNAFVHQKEEIKKPQNTFTYNLPEEIIRKPQFAFAQEKVEIKQAQNAFAPNLPKKEEIKSPQPAFANNLQEKEEVKQMIQAINQQKVIANPVQAFEFDFDAYSREMFKITQEEQVLLKEWIGRPVIFRLTFRGTRDGFNAKSNYNKCKDLKPTLILIKSEHNEVFGGFSSCYDDGYGYLFRWNQADPSAFIFSLTKNTKHSQFQNQKKAMYYDYSKFIIGFGYNDICICNDCDKNCKSSSDIGGTYKPIEEYKQGSKECQTYLAGSKNFKVIEMEVYECII